MMSINDFLAFINDKNLDNISEQTFMDVIDEELQKDETQMDTDLIEFCLLQLEKIQKEKAELSVAEEKKKPASSAELGVLQNNEKKPAGKTRRVVFKTGITAAAVIMLVFFSQTAAYDNMIGYLKTEVNMLYNSAYRLFNNGGDSDTGNNTSESEQTSDGSSADEQTSNEQINNNTPAYGDGDENLVLLNGISENAYVDGQTELSLPLISNPYVFGHGGAEFEVTDTLKASIISDLKTFLDKLNITFTESEWTWNEQACSISKTQNGVNYIASPKYISYYVESNEAINFNMTEEQAKDYFVNNEIATKMCEFIGIKEPTYFYKSTTSNNQNSELIIKAYENGGNFSESTFNANSRYVQMNLSQVDANSYIVWIYCRFYDTSASENVSLISFTNAVADENIDTQNNYIGCYVSYSTDVVSGYLVPCYVFIIDSGNKTDDGKALVYEKVVPMYTVNEAE